MRDSVRPGRMVHRSQNNRESKEGDCDAMMVGVAGNNFIKEVRFRPFKHLRSTRRLNLGRQLKCTASPPQASQPLWQPIINSPPPPFARDIPYLMCLY